MFSSGDVKCNSLNIGYPVTSNHHPVIQIVHSAACMRTCRTHTVYMESVLYKQIADAFGVLGFWQNHYDVKHALTSFLYS